MKKYFIYILLATAYIALSENASGQSLRFYQSVRGAEMLSGTDTLLNAWAGGISNPQFSNLDANNDGRQDLIVFEPVDGKLSVYLSLAGGGLSFAPEYESFFPEGRNWVLFVDYDKDGKADMFTHAKKGAGMDVFRNTSTSGGLKFTQVADVLMYEDIQFDLNLYVPSSDIPAITDVDGDGDVDILSYDVLQTQIQYYKNYSIERYGKPDSLDMRIADRCWGKFAESFSENTVTLGHSCGKVQKRGKKHGGSTLLAVDMDGDGDRDMLMGDIGYDNLIYVKNGRINTGGNDLELDSMIAVEEIWPIGGVNQAKIGIYPAAFLADVNNDGKNDLLVSPQSQYESVDKNHVLLYMNKSSNAQPDFHYVKNTFLLDEMFSGGMYSMPAFWDYNSDGLNDMVVSVKMNEGPGYSSSKLLLYKNIGTQKKAVFSLVNNDFGSMASLNSAGLAPAFADINGDGKIDMAVGNENGGVGFYINEGGEIPEMKQNTIFASIDVGRNSKPAFADLNRDGLHDLVIGRQEGTFVYYKNTGTATQPSYTLITENFGKVRTNRYYYEYTYNDSGKVVDSTLKYEPNGFSSPVIADVDLNGKWDMISGSTHSEILFYLNIEDKLEDSFEVTKNVFFNSLLNKDEERNAGFISSPAIAKLDDDEKPDLMVGNYRGGMYYFSSQQVVLSVDELKKETRFDLKVYPNPAKTNLYISLPKNASVPETGNLALYDFLGRKIISKKITLIPCHAYNLNIPEVTSGIYFLEFSGQKHFSQKVYMY